MYAPDPRGELMQIHGMAAASPLATSLAESAGATMPSATPANSSQVAAGGPGRWGRSGSINAPQRYTCRVWLHDSHHSGKASLAQLT